MPVSKIGINALSTGGPVWDSTGNMTVTSSAGGLPLYVNSTAASQNVRIRLNVNQDTSSVAYVWSNSGAGVNKQVSIYMTSSGALATQVNQTPGGEPTSGTMATFVDASANFSFNSGYGSAAVAYGCRAWVNFNGTGTVAIRSSGNVSSISDNGVGDYTVNFTNAMPDANYSVIATRQIGSNSLQARIFGQNANTAPATGSVRMYSYYYSSGADAAEDTAYAFVAIFR